MLAQFGLNRGNGQHFAFAFFKEHHRHRFADMFARDAAQCAAARAVQTDPDNGLLALVKARPRIDDPLTGKDQVLFQQRRRIAPLRNNSSPGGTGSFRFGKRGASGSARRASSVEVRPILSFALAVSCTLGNSTMMRSAPCCCTSGSATPSSFTRLDKVRMFCCSAFFCIAARASGASAPVSEMPLSASAFDICHCNSLMSLESAARAFSAESLFVKGITIC